MSMRARTILVLIVTALALAMVYPTYKGDGDGLHLGLDLQGGIHWLLGVDRSKAVEAERARIESLDRTISAYEASVRALEEIERYLRVTAPFDGVVTARYAHVGALAGPKGEGSMALFRVEQIQRLRLVAAVPEAYAQSIVRGRKAGFTVPAYPGETFSASVARPSYAVDPQTRQPGTGQVTIELSGRTFEKPGARMLRVEVTPPHDDPSAEMGPVLTPYSGSDIVVGIRARP